MAGDGKDQTARRGVNGLVVLFGIVALGMVTGSVYYSYKRPQLEREREAILAAAPTTAEGRLGQWLTFHVPQIHHRLTQVARFSAEHPWIVTHSVAEADGGPDTIWGVRCDDIGRDLAHLEDLTVVVELPRPAPLGRAELDFAQSRFVPRYTSADEAPDPEARLIELATFFLERLPDALAGDIPGARIELRVVSPGPPSD